MRNDILIEKKSNSYKISKKERTEKTNLWDAFVNYLENNYLHGASEVLEKHDYAFIRVMKHSLA